MTTDARPGAQRASANRSISLLIIGGSDAGISAALRDRAPSGSPRTSVCAIGRARKQVRGKLRQ
jgi:hypothetical protein